MNVELVPVDDLVIHPDNPRVGNIDVIVESIRLNGWYGTIVAQTSTRHVLAGNHRLQAARQAGVEQVPVYWADVDDQTARRILLADNRTADLAGYDNETLVELLTIASESEQGLLGTGWTTEALDVLMSFGDTGNDTDDLVDFPAVTPDGLETEYRCPSCNYEWSGSPRPGEPLHDR